MDLDHPNQFLTSTEMPNMTGTRGEQATNISGATMPPTTRGGWIWGPHFHLIA